MCMNMQVCYRYIEDVHEDAGMLRHIEDVHEDAGKLQTY